MGLTKKVNLNNIIWYGIYWFATFGLCLYGSIYYVYNDNSYLILGAVGAIAKGTAESLKFQGALAMLLMCRSIIFKLCVSFKGKLTQYTPLDNTLKGHIYVGFVFLILSIIHSVCHIVNFQKLGTLQPDDEHFDIFPSGKSVADLWFKTISGVTGIIMCVGLIIVYVGVALRRSHPNFFFYSHWLFILIIILMIFHGCQKLVGNYTAPYYLVLPTLLYAVDKVKILWHEYVEEKGEPHVRLLKASFVGENDSILALETTKPPDFNYAPGSYAFLKLPAVSNTEWHPFTIASSPTKTTLSFFIKKSGDWTSDLHSLLKLQLTESQKKDSDQSPTPAPFIRIQSGDNMSLDSTASSPPTNAFVSPSSCTVEMKPMSNHPNPISASGSDQTTNFNPDLNPNANVNTDTSANNKLPSLKIFGPCAAPSQKWQLYERSVFVCCGIGVTPFISILEHVTQKIKFNAPIMKSTSTTNFLAMRKSGSSVSFSSRSGAAILRQESVASFEQTDSKNLKQDTLEPTKAKYILIWTSRSLKDFRMIESLLLNLIDNPMFEIQLHLTQPLTEEEKQKIMEDALSDPILSKVTFGRPCFEVLLGTILDSDGVAAEPSAPNKKSNDKETVTTALFSVCRRPLKVQLRQIARHHSVPFHAEIF